MSNTELVTIIRNISVDRIIRLFEMKPNDTIISAETMREQWARWVADHPHDTGDSWPAALVAYKKYIAGELGDIP